MITSNDIDRLSRGLSLAYDEAGIMGGQRPYEQRAATIACWAWVSATLHATWLDVPPDINNIAARFEPLVWASTTDHGGLLSSFDTNDYMTNN